MLNVVTDENAGPAHAVMPVMARSGGPVRTLAGDLFTIGLHASGFTQYLRRAPVHGPRQRLSVDERGGLSFGQRGYAR